MEFKIIAPGGNEIQLLNQLPAGLSNNKNVFDNAIVASAVFGQMIFRNFKGSGFEIWFSNYFIKHDTEFYGRADIPVLELHIQLTNRFNIEWDGVGKSQVEPYQFNLTYTPFINNSAIFTNEKEYTTFDVHFTKEYLSHLVESFPALGFFLEEVEKGQPTNLSPVDHFCTPVMITIIQQILNCSFKDIAARSYIESKIMELLLEALAHTATNKILAPIKLSQYDIERLHEAKNLLLADFETKMSLVQLSRKVGINDFKLKKGFKYLFGSTVFDFQQAAKMEWAKTELLETKKSVEEIAYAIGYDFVSNFNIAFKKHFGYAPGFLRKH